MGRPRINPLLRFDFEINMWRTAITKGAAAYLCDTPKQAIHLNHRLNMARAAIRDQSPDGYMDWDLYVARHNGCSVTIARKHEMDLSKITDGAGNPLTADDWQQVFESPVAQTQMPLTAPVPKTPPLTSKPPPPETFDPTKPLGLDIADGEC